MTIDLPLIWAGLIAIAVLMYVILDGFDLGIGILFPAIRKPAHRDVMVNTVAPFWDGNETWLVLGGGGLFAVFPLAYSLLMTAFYVPLIVMLLALIFRGVAFEFRFRDPKHKPFWDLSFMVGSIVATFAQGVVLGGFIGGIETADRAYTGGWYDWLTPFSLLTGAALVAGYGLLGACWLIMKTEGDLQARAYRLAWPFFGAVLIAVAGVSLWTPLMHDEIAARWFTWPNMALLSPVPLLVGALAFALVRALRRRYEYQPFLIALGMFVLSYIGLGISLFPKIVPPSVTIWDAAAPPVSQGFLLVGTLVLLPLILGYTGYVYWVFRGKSRAGEGYHEH
ncbi:MAG: cytochrome d ubiquinol oxidase subunit II [Dongiaceae bacterium]